MITVNEIIDKYRSDLEKGILTKKCAKDILEFLDLIVEDDELYAKQLLKEQYITILLYVATIIPDIEQDIDVVNNIKTPSVEFYLEDEHPEFIKKEELFIDAFNSALNSYPIRYYKNKLKDFIKSFDPTKVCDFTYMMEEVLCKYARSEPALEVTAQYISAHNKYWCTYIFKSSQDDRIGEFYDGLTICASCLEDAEEILISRNIDTSHINGLIIKNPDYSIRNEIIDYKFKGGIRNEF